MITGRRLLVGWSGMLGMAAVAAVALPVFAFGMQVPFRAAGAEMRFEVASIRPCTTTTGRGSTGGSSPGRLHIPCMTAMQIIRLAYNGGLPEAQKEIRGGPSWINSQSYEIIAVGQGAPTLLQLGTGGPSPMLQALLEERFKLRVRREIEEVAVYALNVAPGGLKTSTTAVTLDRGGLERFEEGACRVIDPSDPKLDVPRLLLREQPCSYRGLLPKLPNTTIIGMKSTLDEFARLLSRFLDRPVLDRTSVAGVFNVHLVFAPDDVTPRLFAAFPENADDPPTAPGIFTAMQEQLGLKLEPSKGGVELLVIDSVDRPTEN
jgi:uncharacterized protein (TIGR03435 family)